MSTACDDDRRFREEGPFDELAATWDVGVQGHDWIDMNGERVLTDHVTIGSEVRRYHPLSVGGLFLRFARIPATEDAFSKFADEFGMLGVPDREIDFLHKPGESWSAWETCHKRIVRAVHLWSGIQSGGVGDSIRSPGGAKWIWHRPGKPREMIASKEMDDVSAPIDAAKRFLQDSINANLELQQTETGGRVRSRGVQVRVLWHTEKREYVIRVVPRSLLACMWWQFARAFTGEARLGACKVCSKPFEFGPDGFYSNREFCSPACKQKDHRRKVNEARSLRETGLSPSVIAKQMKTTTDTVKNWLTKKK